MTPTNHATLLPRFFVPHPAAERNVSPHTTCAYRDALKLLLRFAACHLRLVANPAIAEAQGCPLEDGQPLLQNRGRRASADFEHVRCED